MGLLVLGLTYNPCAHVENYRQQQQQQYLFAIGGWRPEGHKSIKAGSKKK